MCQDHHSSGRPISRRTVLKGIAGAAVAGGIAAVVGEELSRSSSSPSSPMTQAVVPRGVVNGRGEQPYSFAGHLHSSFSEFNGSNEAQAVQAKLNRLDALAMTEHDFRMLYQGCRPGFPFTTMSVTEGDGTWELLRSSVGKLGSGSQARIDVASTYPSGGALVMTATSDEGVAMLAYDLDCGSADADYRGNVGGRTVSVDVFPERASTPHGAYLAFFTELSLHPSIDDEPLQIYWRLNTEITAKQYSVTRGTGFVDVPATVGRLQTITPDPAVDFPKLWPGLDPLDNSFVNLGFVAAATESGATAQGWFSNLRFVTDPTYDASAAIHSQQTVAAQAFSRYAPSVLVVPGCEFSRGIHVRQLDGTIFMPDYPPSPLPHPEESVAFTTNMVAQIHQHNSTAVLCHPYGTEMHAPLLTQSQQDRRLKQVTKRLTNVEVYGVDVIEAGYQDRDGMDIEHHQMLWRALSRAGHVLTADGVSDDHTGVEWAAQTNRFITYLWAKQLSAPNLTSALTTGRAYVGELASFSGQLDLWFDNLAVVMGQVSLLTGAGSATRTVWVRADGLPSGSQLNLWRAPIDYTDGSHDSPDGVPNDGGLLVGGSPIEASKFEAGPMAFKVDTSSSCFFWADVLDSTGRTIAFSNMIYQLREPPPAGAPSISSTRLVRE
jgi:hypothetical protein